jgi:hypothetical protein
VRYVSGDIEIVFWSATSTPAVLAAALLAKYPASTVSAPTDTSGELPTGHPSVVPTTTAQGGMTQSTPSTFDPATATRVPAGQSPRQFVAAYHQAILDEEWQTAFEMQPATSRSGDVAAFKATWESYGLDGFKIFSDATTSTGSKVVVRMDLGANGIWNATWDFVKSGDTWLVKTRSKIGMGEPTQ